MFKKVSFTTAIAAIFHVVFITMKRTNYIAKSIDIAIGEKTSGMRTLKCECEELVVVFGNADFLSINFYDSNVVRSEVEFVNVGRDFLPGGIHLMLSLKVSRRLRRPCLPAGRFEYSADYAEFVASLRRCVKLICAICNTISVICGKP